MATKFLKDVLESELKMWGRLTYYEFDVIRKAWLKDMDALNQLLQERIEIKMTEETETDPGHEYSVEIYGHQKSVEDMRHKAVDAALALIQ